VTRRSWIGRKLVQRLLDVTRFRPVLMKFRKLSYSFIGERWSESKEIGELILGALAELTLICI